MFQQKSLRDHPVIMSEKVGLAGNIEVPTRQGTNNSTASDDAVPAGDPKDVSMDCYTAR
jgi:hypothetical protein